MHPSILTFLAAKLTPAEIAGTRVLEVGSQDVNGSPRTAIEPLQPKAYVGIDSAAGPGVDVVGKADQLEMIFGEDAFDVVVSTELLEHVQDWRRIVSQLKRVTKRNGLLVVTTRSPGFPYHPFPIDLWRYTGDHFRRIFADMELITVEPDPWVSGVFMKARKPQAFVEADLSKIEVAGV
jgi:SAM-dependent methyltransferase